jgi:hypothetical protein
MRAGGIEVRAPGIVRVMHPDKGMGVQFTQNTPEHRTALERFLGVLTENRSLMPELLVQAEGLENDGFQRQPSAADTEDPLLQLFYAEPLSTEAFQEALRKQRAVPPAVDSSASPAHA